MDAEGSPGGCEAPRCEKPVAAHFHGVAVCLIHATIVRSYLINARVKRPSEPIIRAMLNSLRQREQLG
jgi:hypothetical protein